MNAARPSSPKKSRRPRRGFTLVEMMVVIGVGSVIFGVAVVSLATMWRIGGRIRTDDQLDAARARLAEQFRTDVRAADAWSTQPNGEEVVIRFQYANDSVVEYGIRNHIVERRREAKDRVSVGDRFEFSEGTSCQVMPDDRVAGQRLLQLRLDAPADDGRSGARREYVVLARLAADRRFNAAAEQRP